MPALPTLTLRNGEYDVWDSGRIDSSNNYGIVYEGRKLRSMERVYWKVLVWDQVILFKEKFKEKFLKTD